MFADNAEWDITQSELSMFADIPRINVQYSQSERDITNLQ